MKDLHEFTHSIKNKIDRIDNEYHGILVDYVSTSIFRFPTIIVSVFFLTEIYRNDVS